jgi:EmrB/QacA subfamily drug resistance transporter
MQGPQTQRRWWALAALALSVLTIGLDATIINVALPTLAVKLHASSGQLQWFAAAYNLVFAIVLLPAGLLGDQLGRKRLLLGALTLFGVASAACAAAPSAGSLIAARAVLGLAGGAIMPLSIAVLPVLFTKQEQPRAMSVWVAANSVAFPLGPILGGLLLEHLWWGSVFLINVPVVALALVAVVRWLPESRGEQGRSVDRAGVLSSSAGLAGITYGAIEAGQQGWGSVAALAPLIAGAALLAGFVLWQRRLEARPAGEPLIDLKLFRSASFTWGTILATLLSFALFGLLFAVPQFFQAVAGADALGQGLRLLPIIGGLLVGSRMADRITPRAGAYASVALGFALVAAGLLVGSGTGVSSGYGFAAIWITLIGVGLGLALPTTMGAAIGELSAARSGVGSALIMALRQVGGTLGVALLGTVLASGYRGRLQLAGLPTTVARLVRESAAAGVAAAHKLGSTALLHSVRAAFVHGTDVMLVVCGAVGVLGLVCALLFLPRGRRGTDAAQAQSGDADAAQPTESSHVVAL